MPESRQDRDIRKQLKSIATYTAKLTKSTAQLFLASGKDIFTTQMPTLTNTYSTNKELLDDTVRFLKNPANAIQKGIQRGMESESYQSIQGTVKLMLEDLKSGNIYDANRDRSEVGAEIDSMLSNFGGMDWSFDENGDWTDSGTDLSDDLTGYAKIADVQEENAAKRTTATIDAIGTSTEAITGTINANSQANIRLSVKQHTEAMTAMHNSLSVQTAQLTAISNGVSSTLEVAREAHTQVMNQMQSMTKLLEEIRDNTKPVEQVRKGYKETDTPFGANGELDVKKYVKTVIKNIDEKFSISSTVGLATTGRSTKDLLELYQSNPWMIVSDLILGQLVPEKLTRQMAKTDTNLRNFVPALLDKLASRGAKTNQYGETSITDMLASVFGVKQRSRTSIDTAIADINKRATFTHKTATAIEVVIPSLLSQINSSISGQPHQTFNYQTGKFERSVDIISKSFASAHNLVSSMPSAQEAIELGGKYNFRNSKEREDFQNYMYEYFHRVANSSEGTFINPFMDPEEFMKTMPDNAKKNLYYKLLMGVFNNMERSDLMAISNDVFNARAARDKNNFRLNQELRDYGTIGAFTGLAADEKLMGRLEAESKISRRGLDRSQIDNLVNKRNRELLNEGGIRATNSILSDMLYTLKRGIITYSFNAGEMNVDSAGSDVLKSILRDREDQDALKTQVYNYVNRDAQNRERRIANENARSDQNFVGPQPLGKGVVTDDWSLESAVLEMAGIRSNETRGDTDNPKVKFMHNMEQKLSGSASRVLERTGTLTTLQKLRNFTESPFTLVEEGLKYVDAFMFKMLYGEDAAMQLEEGGAPSLMRSVTTAVKAQFMDAKEWFKTNIGDPLQDMLFNKDKGILPKFGKSLKEHVIDPIMKPIKTRAGKVKDRVKQKVIGTKDDKTGEYSGGFMSNAINKTQSFTKEDGVIDTTISNALNRMLYGDLVETKGKREYETSAFSPETGLQASNRQHIVEYSGVIGKFRKGFDSVNRFLFGEDFNADDDTRAENARSRRLFKEVTGELKGAAPKMAAGAGLGLLASFFLPGGPIIGAMLGSFGGLTSGSKKFSEYLLGPFAEDVEIVTDVNGNPIMNPDGSPMTKTVKRRQGGKISKQVADGLQRFVPGVTKGALAGAVAGGLGLLPFGLGSTAGMVIGSVGGMLGTSEQVKKLIFGDGVDPESGLISKDFRDKALKQIKNAAGPALGGAVIGNAAWSAISGLGLIPGLSLLPGGPIFTLLGGITGAANADTIKNFLFGEEVETDDVVTKTDPKTGRTTTVTVHKKKRQGGVFGSIFDFAQTKIVDPLAKRVDDAGKKIGDWFKESIVGPIDRSMQPAREAISNSWNKAKDSLKNIGQAVIDGIGDAIGVSFNGKDGTGGLSAFVKEKIVQPLDKLTSKLFGAIGKAIGNIISAPFKAVEFLLTGGVGGNKDDLDSEVPTRDENGRLLKWHERRKAKRQLRRKKRIKKSAARAKVRFDKLLDGIGIKAIKTPADIAGNAVDSDIDPITGLPKVIPLGGDIATDDELAVANGETQEAETETRYDTATMKAIMRHQRKQLEVEYRDRYKAKEKEQRIKAAQNEKKNKVPKRSNNDYLERIDKKLGQIFNEVKGQVNGVGWNTAYIKTLLEKQFGQSLSDDELPEEMEGSKRQIRKRRTIFGRIKDAAADRFGRAKDWVSEKVDKVLGPFRVVAEFFGNLHEGAKKLRHGLWEFTKKGAKGLAKGAKGLGGFLWELLLDIKDITTEIVKGAVTGLKDAFTALTGVLSDGVRAASAVVGGLVETAAEIAPDIALAAWDGMKFLGTKALQLGGWVAGKAWNGLKHLKNGATGGVRWAFNKIFHRGGKDGEVSGGPGGLADSVHIKIGPKTNPVNYPYVEVMRGKLMGVKATMKAIPVYLVGSSPDNVTQVELMKNRSPETPTTSPSDRVIGNSQNQFRVNGVSGPGHAVAGDNVASKLRIGSTEQQEATKEAKKEQEKQKQEKLSIFERYKRHFRRIYQRADKAAETSASGNVGQVYDQMIASAKNMDEVEAIRTVHELNSSNQLALPAPGGSSDQTTSSDNGFNIFELLFGGGKKAAGLLKKAAIAAAPSLMIAAGTAYGLTNEGEGHVARNALGAGAKNLLRNFGVSKLSFNQIKDIFADPTKAAAYSSMFAQESAEALTKGGSKRAAARAAGMNKTGMLANFLKMVRDPEYAASAVSSANLMGGKVKRLTNLENGAANIIRGIGDRIGSFGSNIGSKFAKAADTVKNSNVAKNAVSVAGKAKTALEGKLKKLLESKAVKAMLGSTIAKKTTAIINVVTKHLFGPAFEKASKIAGKEALESAARTLGAAATGGLLTIGLAVTDFITGYNAADTIFNVRSSSLSIGMKVTSGVVRTLTGLISTIPGFGTILSIALSFAEDAIVQGVYSIVGKDSEKAELADAQEKLAAEAAAAGVSIDEYIKKYDKNGKKKESFLAKAKNAIGNFFGFGEKDSETGTGWGTGVKPMSQRAGKYNKYNNNMALAGCGPVAASMVGSAYGDKRNPMIANKMSYNMGMRASDGGTNPAFFSQYANSFGAGYGMSEGPVNVSTITSNLQKGQPVILMGRGGAFGGHMHYMVADGTDGRGGVSFVDPMTGARRNARMHDLVQNTKSAVYSYGTGPSTNIPSFMLNPNATPTVPDASAMMQGIKTGAIMHGNDIVNNIMQSTADAKAKAKEETNKKAQALLVDKMTWLKQNPIPYSLTGPQDPDKGSASCASTVGWAYRKVLGLEGMSASSATQSKDDRFQDVIRLGQPGGQPGKTFDLSLLQPGDIVYMFNKWNGGSSNHTEMYIGNGEDLSHGGPEPGPQVRTLDAARQKKVWAVRRYKGFMDGTTPVRIEDTAYNNDTSASGGLLSKIARGVGGFFTDIIKGAKGALSGMSENMQALFGDLLGAVWGPQIGIDNRSPGGETTTISRGGGFQNTVTSNTSASSIAGNSNGKKIFNYLVGKGLTANQAAGIMGNLYKESGLDPKNLQNSYNKSLGYTDDEYTNAVDSGSYKNFNNDSAGYGLAQWTYHTRKQALLESAKKSGKSIGDLGLHLDYLWNELNSAGFKDMVLNPIKKTTTIRDATKIFLQQYERPAGYMSEDKVNARTQAAEQMLQTYGTGKGGYNWNKFGTGVKSSADANSEYLEDRIRRLNKMITSTQEEAKNQQATDVAENIKRTITDGGAGPGMGDPTVLEVLNSIAASMNVMVKLLTEIKGNTAAQPTAQEPARAGKYANLPSAENGSGAGEVSDRSEQYMTGADIINRLTSK